jgi:hypothetical protein
MAPVICDTKSDGLPVSLHGEASEEFSPARFDWAVKVIAAVLILLSAAVLYQRFRQDAQGLWYSAFHDRNGHYLRGQRMAVALREGNVGDLVKEVNAATVWPPLHPLLTGPVLAVTGIDYRLAVLPSLAAWAATCWFAFILARRLVPNKRNLAGFVALLFTIVSPAHRAFATDIMIESVGAALTLAALYFYVTALDERSAWRGRCFAFLFLALFLAKYNYWTLLAVGLLLATLYRFRSSVYAGLRVWRPSLPLPSWWNRQLRQPLTYLLLAAFALGLYVKFVGNVSLTWAGRRVNIGSLDFPALVCYILVLLRVLPWWWSRGRWAAAELPIPARQAIHWFVYPLAVWFLWPRRLGVFLWSVTYTHHGRVSEFSPWTGSLPYYWGCLGQDYHANVASLVLVLILIAAAILGWRRWEKGTATIFIFLVVAALLTNYHSANRSRFLHSWLAVGWIAAGVGAAQISAFANRAFVSLLGTAISTRVGGLSFSRFLRPALLFAALAGLVGLQGSVLFESGHAEEGGPNVSVPSLLVVADSISPELRHARKPVLVSNAPFHQLLDWRLCEFQGPHRRIQTPPQAVVTSAGEDQLGAWLQRSDCDSLLLMEWPTNFGLTETPELDVAALRGRLASSGDFVLTTEWLFPAYGNIRAQLWRPASGMALAQSQRRGD